MRKTVKISKSILEEFEPRLFDSTLRHWKIVFGTIVLFPILLVAYIVVMLDVAHYNHSLKKQIWKQ